MHTDLIHFVFVYIFYVHAFLSSYMLKQVKLTNNFNVTTFNGIITKFIGFT